MAPQNLDAEQHVLGAMMLSPAAIVAVGEILAPEDFYRASHGVIFAAAVGLHGRGEPVDAITLADELEERGELEDVGGRIRVNELAALVPAASNAPHYARIVRKMAVRRGLVRVGAGIRQLGSEPEGEPIELVQRAFVLVGELAASATEPVSSWRPVALTTVGALPPEPPTVAGIVYPGRLHVWSGEPESLKSMVALAVMAGEVKAGRQVVYVDLENGARETLARLRALGLDDAEIEAGFVYLTPGEPIGRGLAEVARIVEESRPSLVTIDSYTASLELHGFDPNASVDVERHARTVLAPFRQHGAAVLVIDHVVKDGDRRGRFSIGSERKLAVAEVHAGFEVAVPFGRGRTGVVRLVTHKDRPGFLPRPTLGEVELRSDPATGAIEWTIRPAQPAGVEPVEFRPTKLMERVSRYLERQAGRTPRGTIEKNVRGSTEWVRRALDLLVQEGYAEEQKGARDARLYTSHHPFREHDLAHDLAHDETRDLALTSPITSPTTKPPNQATSPNLAHHLAHDPEHDLAYRLSLPSGGDGDSEARSQATHPAPNDLGGANHLDHLNDLHDAGHLTGRERRERRLLHLAIAARRPPDPNHDLAPALTAALEREANR